MRHTEIWNRIVSYFFSQNTYKKNTNSLSKVYNLKNNGNLKCGQVFFLFFFLKCLRNKHACKSFFFFSMRHLNKNKYNHSNFKLTSK